MSELDVAFVWNAIMSSWVKRALLCCSAITMISFIRTYLSRRRLREYKLKRAGHRKEDASTLHKHALLTFVWCICAALVFLTETIPSICRVTILLRPSAMFYPHIFLSLYQLIRLKASFNSSANADDITAGLAYPNCIYIALYIVGIMEAVIVLLIPLTVRLLLSSMTSSAHELPYHSGCSFAQSQIARKSATLATFLYAFVVVTYLVWDWFIVGMYVGKLYQLQARFRQSSKSRTVIREFLKKILFLTMITETTILIVFVWTSIINFLPSESNRDSLVWISAVGLPIDLWITFLVLYLMLDENHEHYLMLLQWMKRCGCLRLCCCCFGDLESEYERMMLRDCDSDGVEEEEEKQRDDNKSQKSRSDPDGNDITVVVDETPDCRSNPTNQNTEIEVQRVCM